MKRLQKLYLWDWLRGRRGKARQVIAVITYGVVALVVIGAAAGGGSSSPNTSQQATAHRQSVGTHSAPKRPKSGSAPPVSSVAEKLAYDETGQQLPPNNPLVQAFAQHVSSLDRKCRGSDVTVAASIDFASTDLAKHGIVQSRSSLAADLDKNIHGFPPNFDCQGFVAAYLIIRENGH